MRAPRFLLFPLLLAPALGCEVDGTDEEPFEDFDEPLDDVGITECADLQGTFVADALQFTALDDPEVLEDFGGLPDLTVEFAGDTFTSILVEGDQAFTTTGTFTVVNDQVLFSAPFLAGVGTQTTLSCAVLDGGGFSLSGDTTFDFDDDDDLVDFVDAEFIGILSPF